MKAIYKLLFFVVLIVLLLPSCKDEWDEHYKNMLTETSNMLTSDYISSQPELSKFDTMLIISGYDTVLRTSQSYTVWAPDNNALADVDLTNVTLVKDIVENHISLLTIPANNILKTPVYFYNLNNKVMLFGSDNEGLKYNGKLLTSYDHRTLNGIVHIINEYVPFQPNIYEYIRNNPDFSFIDSYINSFWDSVFVSSNGLDSTFLYKNSLFDQIGSLNTEVIDDEDAFTMILPNDSAWKHAYMKIKEYYVSKHEKAEQIQNDYTNFAIIKDLVFHKRIFNPFQYDSLITTSKNVFRNPAYLFGNSGFQEVSNGLVYVTDTFRYRSNESWAKEIRIEAEETGFGRTPYNCYVINRYYFGSDFDVSNKRYVVVDPATSSSFSKIYVDFPIPSTLSATYNIYCVFVPAIIEDTLDHRPNKASFYITYMGSDKVMKSNQALNVVNSVTDTAKMTKMLIASNFKFPFSHISPEESQAEVVKIRVQNEVKAGKIPESTQSRTMRIDCIILEPVAE